MKKLNESEKDKLLETLNEKGLNFTKEELEEKINFAKKLKDEELGNITGGINDDSLERYLENKERRLEQVQGPKIELIECNFCHRKFTMEEMKTHIIVEHMAQLIKDSEIF